MKKTVITLLICLNIGLLAVLMFGETDRAIAQVGYYNETDYALVTGKVETDLEVVYVIDMASQQLGVWKYNLSPRRMSAMDRRSLADDFRGN